MRITLLMTLATALSCGTGKTKLTEDVDPNRDPLPESDTADSGAADSGSSPTDDTASTTDTSTTDTGTTDTGTADTGTTDTGPAPCIADPATPGEDTAHLYGSPSCGL